MNINVAKSVARHGVILQELKRALEGVTPRCQANFFRLS